eukprot:sb/3463368/
MDVQHLLLALMTEHSPAIVPVFEELGGVNVLFHLVKHECESVRLYAIKTLGSYLSSCTAKTSARLITKSSIFTVIAEYISPRPVTIATYNVLCELTLAHMSRQVTTDKFFDPDPDAKIKYPQLLEVIAVLLLKRRPEEEEGESNDTKIAYLPVVKQYLTTLLLLLQRSRENRRVLISQNGWQRWMVGLMIHWTDCGSEGQHISDIAYSLFQTLLHHALQWEQDGWLVWVETLSILHAYQSDGQGEIAAQQPSDQYDSCRADDEASYSSEQHQQRQVVPDILVEPETPRPPSEASVEEKEGGEVKEDIPAAAPESDEREETDVSSEDDLEETPADVVVEDTPAEVVVEETEEVVETEEQMDPEGEEEEGEVQEEVEREVITKKPVVESVEEEEEVTEIEITVNGIVEDELPKEDKNRVPSSDSGVEEEEEEDEEKEDEEKEELEEIEIDEAEAEPEIDAEQIEPETEAATDPETELKAESVPEQEDQNNTTVAEEEEAVPEALEEEDIAPEEEEEGSGCGTEDEQSLSSSSEPRLEHQCTPVPEPRVAAGEVPIDMRDENSPTVEEQVIEPATGDIVTGL